MGYYGPQNLAELELAPCSIKKNTLQHKKKRDVAHGGAPSIKKGPPQHKKKTAPA